MGAAASARRRSPSTANRSASLKRDEFLEAMHGLEQAVRDLITVERERSTAAKDDLQKQIDGLRLEIAQKAAGEYRSMLITGLGFLASVSLTLIPKLLK